MSIQQGLNSVPRQTVPILTNVSHTPKRARQMRRRKAPMVRRDWPAYIPQSFCRVDHVGCSCTVSKKLKKAREKKTHSCPAVGSVLDVCLSQTQNKAMTWENRQCTQLSCSGVHARCLSLSNPEQSKRWENRQCTQLSCSVHCLSAHRPTELEHNNSMDQEG